MIVRKVQGIPGPLHEGGGDLSCGLSPARSACLGRHGKCWARCGACACGCGTRAWTFSSERFCFLKEIRRLPGPVAARGSGDVESDGWVQSQRGMNVGEMVMGDPSKVLASGVPDTDEFLLVDSESESESALGRLAGGGEGGSGGAGRRRESGSCAGHTAGHSCTTNMRVVYLLDKWSRGSSFYK